MADAHHVKKPIDNIIYAPFDAGVTIEIGDLLYWDGTYAQPASAQADAGTELLNQSTFGPNFLGVANSKTLGTETVDGEVAVITDAIFYFPCESATFVLGDLVAPDEASSGTALEDQELVKVTDETAAIGKVTKVEASAVTKVWVRLTSRVLGNAASPDVTAVLSSATLPVITFNGSTGANIINVPTNQAAGLTVKDSAGNLIVVDTTTGTQVITITPAVTITGMLTANGGMTLGSGDNIVLSTTTGTKIGTGTTQLLGFWNATPVDQPAHVADPAAAASLTGEAIVTTNMEDGSANNTLEAITDTSMSDQSAAIERNLDKLADGINELVVDTVALKAGVDANNAAIDSILAQLAEIGLQAAA